MLKYGRVQFVSICLGYTSITLILNKLHAWECFLVAPHKKRLTKVGRFFVDKVVRYCNKSLYLSY